MNYISTRGYSAKTNSAQAIIRGLAPDRGLFVPEEIPPLGIFPEDLKDATFKGIAGKVLSKFLNDFDVDEIVRCVNGAYDEKYDSKDIVPLVATRSAFFLELYHGRTAAFKDIALSILPYLLISAIRKEKEEKKIVILTATSGDTGKAALEGFSGVSGTEIIVFYPKDGVSEIQKRQMTTQRGSNVHVYAIEGNFDVAQAGVKGIFANEEFAHWLDERGYKLSSANSINIGRLVPQISYYVYAYTRLIRTERIRAGEPINVVVPTGNFGNILAAYYAKQMGVPIAKFICASNENNVLTEFINTGVYNAKREFFLTTSPSMDILVSSNLERLLWHLSGGNSAETSGYMKVLEATGKYAVGARIRDGLKDFYGGYAPMRIVHAYIRELWEKEKYLMDTHTAVGYAVYMKYREQTGDSTPTVIASTASAYKFASSVSQSLGLPEPPDGFAAIDALSAATEVRIPDGLKNLQMRRVIHTETITAADMISTIAKIFA
ncbi:MAG: threonine synthase [Clostridiales Family XIII bacterium]|jgi:threonine synthase|nr:threonine synthase [Clostridiales Family XIII bacterium]